ncbi:MAG: flagellar basal body rod protein FlgC [bacterium]
MTTISQQVTAQINAQMRQGTPAGGAPRPMFHALGIAAGGLSAQRARLEVAAQNIANAETTRTSEGGAYRRKVVSLEAINDPTTPRSIDLSALAEIGGVATLGVPSLRTMPGQPDGYSDEANGGVRVAGVFEDPTQGALVYDPGHPDSDANGYVRMPNVQITDEMMEMMDARRVYDANATVFQAAKAMLHRAIEI